MALPFNNKQVLDNPDLSKDRFFLLGEFVTESCFVGDPVHFITVSPDGPIVALDVGDKAQIEQESGVVAPLRKDWDNKDKRKEYGLPESLRMIGAGGIVSVQIGEKPPLTVLFEKTAGPSKGRMAQASGLSDRNPLQTAWAEIVEETGILTVDRENQRLELLVLEPYWHEEAAFENGTEQTAFFDALEEAKKAQIDTIRSRLPEDIRNWDIAVVATQVEISPEDEAYLETVWVSLPERDPLKARVLVSDSDKTANVNLLYPVRLELPEGTESFVSIRKSSTVPCSFLQERRC